MSRNLNLYMLVANSIATLLFATACSNPSTSNPLPSKASNEMQSAKIDALPPDYDLCDEENAFLDALIGRSFAQASESLKSHGFLTTPSNATHNAEQWKEGIACEQESCRAHLFLRGDVGQAITLDLDGPSETAKVTGAWDQAYPGQCGANVG